MQPKADLRATLKNRVNRGGFCATTIYILIVAAVFTFTAYNTKPSNVGLDWIPFMLLSMPWYGISTQLLLPGLVANAVLMYLLGTLLDSFWRWLTREKAYR